jgi:DNA-binding protein YbaB
MADFMGLMKQAAELKSKMEAMKNVAIDSSLMKPEEKEIAEDLIVAAHADARRKAEALLQEKMKHLTGGLPLPPGLKLF